MKFKFQSVNDEGITVTKEFEANNWFNVLEHFITFLQGCGFYIYRKSVGINTTLHNTDKLFCHITTFSED